MGVVDGRHGLDCTIEYPGRFKRRGSALIAYNVLDVASKAYRFDVRRTLVKDGGLTSVLPVGLHALISHKHQSLT